MLGKLRNLTLILLLLTTLCFARKREQPGGTFSIDVDHPYDKVVDVLRDVVNDGVILGTFEYKDTQELPNAESAHPCPFFKPWTGNGEIFCKVRRKALSPAHFIGSNDMGTVAVRYIVQSLTPTSTHLLIDAVFFEDARHSDHPSDGSVETSEFGLIQQHLRTGDPKSVDAEGDNGTDQESSSRGEPVDSGRTGDLQQAILDQRAAVDAANANLSQLQARAQQLEVTATARVTADRAEVKTLPYNHAQVVQVLEKGQQVIVLTRSAYWWRVRSADGQEGWLHHSVVEGQP